MLNLPPNRRARCHLSFRLNRERDTVRPLAHGWREFPPSPHSKDCPPSAVLLCTELRRYEQFLRDSCSPLFLYFSFLCVPLPRNNPELQQLHISTCHAGQARQWRGEAEALAAAPSQRRDGVRFTCSTNCQKTKIHLPLSCFGGNYLKCFSDIPGSLPSYKITLRF